MLILGRDLCEIYAYNLCDLNLNRNVYAYIFCFKNRNVWPRIFFFRKKNSSVYFQKQEKKNHFFKEKNKKLFGFVSANCMTHSKLFIFVSKSH